MKYMIFTIAIAILTSLQLSAAATDTPVFNIGDVSRNEDKIINHKLSFDYDVILVDTNGQEHCLPRGEEVRILNYDDGVYELYRITNYFFTSKSDEEEEKKLINDYKEEENQLCYRKGKEKPPLLKRGDSPIKVKENVGGFVVDYGEQKGWTYGALVVPYKYYIKPGDITGAATVAPYAGYRWDLNPTGFEFRPIFFAGPTVLTGIEENGDSTSLFGLSVGLGLLFEINNEFNAGFVVGKDYVSSGDKSKFDAHADKWIALSLGYDFSN